MLDPAPAGKMLVETLTSALGVQVLRHHSNLDSASVSLPVVRGALDPQRLRRVMEFIDTNLGRDLTIEALANEACLSPFHFARAFKAATGMAPHSYVTERRVERAKSWISEGRPLSAITLRVRPFLPGILHEVVQATCRCYTGGVSRWVPVRPAERGCGGVLLAGNPDGGQSFVHGLEDRDVQIHHASPHEDILQVGRQVAQCESPFALL